MVIAFIYGALVGAATGWAGWAAWRRLPTPLNGLAGLAAAAAVLAAVAVSSRAGVHLAGGGDWAGLILGLVAGNLVADLAPSGRTAYATYGR